MTGTHNMSARARWARTAVRDKIFDEMTQMGLNREAQPANLEGQFTTMELDAPVLQLPLFGSIPIPPTKWDLPHDDALQEALRRRQDGHEPAGLAPGAPDAYHEQHRLCIIGAGVTGLYIAMILDDLNIDGLTYEILEASDRTGGRLYTHNFSKTTHDYYDIGAMRFPHLNIMQRTFDLFKQLDVPLITYYLGSDQGAVNCPTMYNDIVVIDADKAGFDPFKISKENNGSVPTECVKKGVDDLLDAAFGPFKKAMWKDFMTGFKWLMEYDDYSTREFLKNPPKLENVDDPPQKLDFFTIQWLETNNTSSGLFDQAFSESVIDAYDFSAPDKDTKVKWSCIEGGGSKVSEAMAKRIAQPIEHGKRVNKITQDSETKELIVSVVSEPKPRKPYTTVFNTTTLGCLQRMDLTGLTLHPSQKDAIRALHYDDSAKVAIKFKYPWWRTMCGITSGGVASCDIPLRTCVYPSYNIADGKEDPAVLLCSYTWAQDATRIGSLILSKHADDETELKALMIDNLARLHQRNFDEFSKKQPKLDLDGIRKLISDAYIEHHGFSWSHDPYTSGAFALFGPAQFTHLYPYLSRPAADSRFHMCGEASSCHHAWVVGSLNSAYIGVQNFLRRFNMFDKIAELKERWGTVDEMDDGVEGTLHLQVILGQLDESRMAVV